MGNSWSEGICGGSEETKEQRTQYGVWMEPEDDLPSTLSPALRWSPSPAGRDESKELEPPATTDEKGNGTVWTVMEHALKENGKKKCCGWRQIVKREMEGKFEKLTLADHFDWWTYKDLEEHSVALAKGLPLTKGDAVLIFAETQRDWIVTALACFRQGCVVVTAYATLGEEGVTTALSQTKAKLCVCDAKLLKILAKAKDLPSSLTNIATIGKLEDDSSKDLLSKFDGKMTVTTLEDLQEEGRNVASKDPAAVDPQDTAVIMYTSGTTGKSKGVVISHESVVSMTLSYVKTNPQFTSADVYAAYLPLAHIMELTIEMWLLKLGASMGYGSPHTLTDTGVKLAKGCKGDAPILRPTAMLFAPAVLDKVYAAVQRKANSSKIAKMLFSSALAEGEKRFHAGQFGAGSLWDAVVMKKVQALIGGRVRYMASGSAPLSPSVQIFIQTCFDCPVRQGYGCTETCGGSCIGHADDNTLAQVGPPTPVTYLRLRDWDEGGYRNADVDNPDIQRRRGEILLGGPSICKGYFVDEENPDPAIIEKNNEDFTTIAGVKYFCTGDVGEVDACGRLKIVDRKKDLFKGAAGEYVALSKVEAALKLSKFVEMPMVYGETGQPDVIALICPQPPAIIDLAKDLGIASKDPVALCKEPKILAAISEALTAQCKASKLHAFETPKAFGLVIAPDGSPAWTPDNDLLTSTMKLKRPAIAKAFKSDLDSTYANIGKPVKV